MTHHHDGPVGLSLARHLIDEHDCQEGDTLSAGLVSASYLHRTLHSEAASPILDTEATIVAAINGGDVVYCLEHAHAGCRLCNPTGPGHWEFAVTEHARKGIDEHRPPRIDPGEDEGKGPWLLDYGRGRPGEAWDRFDHHEERYWRRWVPSDPEPRPEDQALHPLRLLDLAEWDDDALLRLITLASAELEGRMRNRLRPE